MQESRIFGHSKPLKHRSSMLLLKSDSLPEGEDWLIELKLDGYRALAIKIAERSSSDRATRTISLTAILRS